MPTKQQLDELITKAIKCDKEIPLRKAAIIFLNVMEEYATNKEGPFKYIQEKLGSIVVEETVISIIGSYIASLYTCSNFDNIDDATKFAKEHGITNIKEPNNGGDCQA